MLVDDIEPNAKTRRVHEYIAKQFATPQGIGGVGIAAVMRLINWLPYRGAVGLLDLKPDANVLEIGHGPGFGLAQLSRKAPKGHVVGVDPSATMRRLARAKNANAVAAGRISLVQGNFERLPFSDASMDGILAVNVLYFVDPISSALAEARRVLRPGGTLSVYVTDRSQMSWLQFDGPDTKYTFDEQSLYRLLRASDFGEDLIEIQRMWLPCRFRGLLARLTKEG